MATRLRLSRTLAVFGKETTQILRDRRALLLSLGLSMLLLSLFGFGVSLDLSSVAMAVSDRDGTSASRRLARRFSSSPFFSVRPGPAADEEIEELLTSGAAKAVLVIARGYGHSLARRETAEVQLLIDGSDSNVATIIRGNALTLLQEASLDQMRDWWREETLRARRGPRAEVLPIELRSRILYNPTLTSRNYFVPGLIGILMTTIGVLLPAISFVREEERGTLEALRFSTLAPVEILLGKLGPYFFIGLANLALVLLANRYLFGIETRGPWSVLLVGSVLLLVASLGLGLLVSTLTRTQQGAMVSAFVGTVLPVMYLSDFVFSIRSMPDWLRWASCLVPARYYIAVVRGVVQKGVGFDALQTPLLQLSVYCALVLVAGVLAIRMRFR
jgi:ABC-2 type transport system permease protein